MKISVYLLWLDTEDGYIEGLELIGVYDDLELLKIDKAKIDSPTIIETRELNIGKSDLLRIFAVKDNKSVSDDDRRPCPLEDMFCMDCDFYKKDRAGCELNFFKGKAIGRMRK